MTDTAAEGSIDTAYFHAVDPFDGRPDNPDSDCAATKIRLQPCGIEEWVVSLTVDRTNIRVDMTAADATKLAEQLLDYAAVVPHLSH